MFKYVDSLVVQHLQSFSVKTSSIIVPLAILTNASVAIAQRLLSTGRNGQGSFNSAL